MFERSSRRKFPSYVESAQATQIRIASLAVHAFRPGHRQQHRWFESRSFGHHRSRSSIIQNNYWEMNSEKWIFDCFRIFLDEFFKVNIFWSNFLRVYLFDGILWNLKFCWWRYLWCFWKSLKSVFWNFHDLQSNLGKTYFLWTKFWQNSFSVLKLLLIYSFLSILGHWGKNHKVPLIIGGNLHDGTLIL